MTGPHLKRRMAFESGQEPSWRSTSKESRSRTRTTYFGGDTDVEEFLQTLRAKFGSVARAWRVGLDADQNGSLDFREFCQSVRALGYTGNLRTLYFNLDTDTSGTISLMELDRHAAETLEKFRARSTQRFGTIEKMWAYFDKDQSGTVAFSEFLDSVHVLGYDDETEVKELFSLLQVRVGSRYLTLDDIIFLQRWDDTKRAQIWKKRVGTQWINRDPDMIRGPNPAVSGLLPGLVGQSDEDLSAPARSGYSDMVALDLEKQADDFRNFLIKQFGTLSRAFQLMDNNDSGFLSLTEFITVVSSSLQYCRPGDARRLFMMLSGEHPHLTWDRLGIDRQEWVAHLLERRKRQQWLEDEARAQREAKLGTGARQQRSYAAHLGRIRHAEPRPDVAFWSPLPSGWGFPPDFRPYPASSPNTSRMLSGMASTMTASCFSAR